jgi:hypothetical protein
MTNFISFDVATDEAYLAAHEVKREQLFNRVGFFEAKYRDVFPGGWRDFLVAYTLRRTDHDNLDYDEWAFLCEQFEKELTEPWRPPDSCADSQEKPEATSGFSFGGQIHCLINLTRKHILTGRKHVFQAVKDGQRSMVSDQLTPSLHLTDSSDGN